VERQKFGSQNSLLNVNLLPKIVTGQEFGSQISLMEGNFAPG